MSNLVVSNISDGTTSVGTGYVVNGSAKAWVNFNGTGTIAIRDSLNVSSLTDNATGDYTDTFTNSFSNTNWATQGSTGDTSGIVSFSIFYDYSRTASSQRMLHIHWSTGSSIDPPVCEQVFTGDLA